MQCSSSNIKSHKFDAVSVCARACVTVAVLMHSYACSAATARIIGISIAHLFISQSLNYIFKELITHISNILMYVYASILLINFFSLCVFSARLRIRRKFFPFLSAPMCAGGTRDSSAIRHFTFHFISSPFTYMRHMKINAIAFCYLHLMATIEKKESKKRLSNFPEEMMASRWKRNPKSNERQND